MTYQFLFNIATAQQVQEHLKICSESFLPPLHTKVSLAEYAQKIITHAVRFEAWQNNTLIGLVAAYMNNVQEAQAFITNVSVERAHQGRGVAFQLLTNCIEHARQKRFSTLVLEVSPKSLGAITLYQKVGFNFVAETKQGSVRFTLPLS